jgi:hypothetical protein
MASTALRASLGILPMSLLTEARQLGIPPAIAEQTHELYRLACRGQDVRVALDSVMAIMGLSREQSARARKMFTEAVETRKAMKPKPAAAAPKPAAATKPASDPFVQMICRWEDARRPWWL